MFDGCSNKGKLEGVLLFEPVDFISNYHCALKILQYQIPSSVTSNLTTQLEHWPQWVDEVIYTQYRCNNVRNHNNLV